MGFPEYLQDKAEDTGLLIQDMQAMIDNAKNPKPDQSTASRKSLEPITRLRENTEELKAAEEQDPEMQFVVDKLRDIFGG